MPEVSNLGPYPILQLAAAILIFAGIGWAVLKGMRDKPAAAEEESGRWFFDGPLKRHLEVQEEIGQHIKSACDICFRMENEKIGEELRNQTRLLERIAGALERRR